MSYPTSPLPTSPTPSNPSNKLTASLNAARRGESPIPSTPARRTQSSLTPTARKQALRDFYNLDKAKLNSSTDLDRENFDGKEYVDKLVKERNLATLIVLENDLVQDIRNLDGERKSLVYDNYNKLIAATETIRKMKTHLNPLDPNQSTLRPSIQRISELSTSLTPIDEPTDTNDILATQIRWALQLPERIRHLVKQGHPDRAEREMEHLKTLLGKWENVSDAQDILNQCKAALAFVQS